MFSCYLNMNMPELEAIHGMRKSARFKTGKFHRMKSRNFYLSIREKLKGKEYVVMNLPPTEGVYAMFYLPFSCYEMLPDLNTITELKKKGLYLAVIKQEKLPDYIENDNEIIKLIPPDKDPVRTTKIHLQAYNKKYLCEDLGNQGNLIADRASAAGWETFNLIQFRDSSCAIQGPSGNYFSTDLLDKTTPVACNRQRIDDWEHYKVIWLNEKEIAIKSCTGEYLCMQQDGSIAANQDTLKNECKFNLKYP